MQKGAIKELMYGGIKELMQNSRYYYRSSVSRDYCHFTEEGKIAVYQFVSEISDFISEAEDAELDKRAKDMVMKELTKVNNG